MKGLGGRPDLRDFDGVWRVGGRRVDASGEIQNGRNIFSEGIDLVNESMENLAQYLNAALRIWTSTDFRGGEASLKNYRQKTREPGEYSFLTENCGRLHRNLEGSRDAKILVLRWVNI